MSTFLDSLDDKLTAIEQEMRNLPGDLDSIVARLDRGKLRSLFLSLNQDFNKLLDKLFGTQRSRVLTSPFIITPEPPYIRLITGEDLSRWREANKSDVRVVIGKGTVRVMAASELVAQQQGYIVLSWDKYQKLLAEMGKLIGEDEESLSGTIVGIPLTTTDSTQGVKILPKSLPS